MELLRYRDEQKAATVFKITVPDNFVVSECELLPKGYRNLITLEQSNGILEDAILIAMHVRKKTK